MITNFAGIPAGDGYLTKTSVAGENIIPSLVAAIKAADPHAAPIFIQTVSLQVGTDTQVSINGRSPVLIQANTGLSFDVRGSVTSIVFSDAVTYNIAVSY